MNPQEALYRALRRGVTPYGPGAVAISTTDALAALAEAGYTIVRSADTARPGLDVEALYAAILDELVVLWGEPSDAVSAQVRPIVARSIVDRYAARLTEAT